MLEALRDNLTTGVDDLRVIVLCSNGPVWSAGHDLKELVCISFLIGSPLILNLGNKYTSC